jgi:hypothetical protein
MSSVTDALDALPDYKSGSLAAKRFLICFSSSAFLFVSIGLKILWLFTFGLQTRMSSGTFGTNPNEQRLT